MLIQPRSARPAPQATSTGRRPSTARRWRSSGRSAIEGVVYTLNGLAGVALDRGQRGAGGPLPGRGGGPRRGDRRGPRPGRPGSGRAGRCRGARAELGEAASRQPGRQGGRFRSTTAVAEALAVGDASPEAVASLAHQPMPPADGLTERELEVLASWSPGGPTGRSPRRSSSVGARRRPRRQHPGQARRRLPHRRRHRRHRRRDRRRSVWTHRLAAAFPLFALRTASPYLSVPPRNSRHRLTGEKPVSQSVIRPMFAPRPRRMMRRARRTEPAPPPDEAATSS